MGNTVPGITHNIWDTQYLALDTKYGTHSTWHKYRSEVPAVVDLGPGPPLLPVLEIFH